MKIKAVTRVLLKTVLPLVVGMAFLIGVIAWMAGVFVHKIEPGEAVASDRVTAPADSQWDTVHEVRKEYLEEAVGTLKAASRTEVSARVLAMINKIYVTAGTTVKEGDRLIDLDPRQLETQLSQASAGLVAAEAAASEAQSDYERAVKMIGRNLISQQEMDAKRGRRDVTRAELDHARQAKTEAEVMLSYTTIKAPKAGMIVDKLAQEGDTAQPGVPLLVLYDPASLRLEVPVMENLAVKLKVGQPLTVEIGATGGKVQATVDEIVPQAEAASRSFLVKVKLPRLPRLKEGMYGRLLVPAGQREHLCLNTAAIDTIGQLEFVWVIRPDRTMERRFIQTGRLGFPGRVEVLSGLKAGEKVLLVRKPEETSESQSPPEPSGLPEPSHVAPPKPVPTKEAPPPRP